MAINPRDIGTDLLRTLVAVVDERSYTRAASRLGISQPTVSMHIKRLQELLGFDVLDKSVPGVQLTAHGEATVNHARQILTIHDNLLQQIERTDSPHARVCLGIPSASGYFAVLPALAEFRTISHAVTIDLRRELSDTLLDLLRAGVLDVCAALSSQPPRGQAVYYWETELVWIAAPDFPRPFTSPLNVIGRTVRSIGIESMVAALLKAGMEYRVVLNTSDIDGTIEAARAGIGVTVLARSNDLPPFLQIPGGEDGLPRLGRAFWGVYINDRSRSALTERLAALIADALAPITSEVVADPAMPGIIRSQMPGMRERAAE